MIVRELGNSVPRALIDGTGYLASLDMSNTKIHVGRGDGGGQRLVAVADQQDDIRLEPLEFAGELYDAEADRLGHGGRRRAFQLDIDFAVHLEAVAFQHVDGEDKTLEHHSAGGDHLKLQLG